MRLFPRARMRPWLGVAGACAALVMATGLRSSTQDVFAPLPLAIPEPADNPSTPGKVELGRLLFWDPILSGPRDVACATCHHPDHGYADGLDLPIGVTGTGLGATRQFRSGSDVPFVRRNSPTLLNVAFNGLTEAGRVDPRFAPMFWDVRARGLEAQALVPIEAFEEMRGTGHPEHGAVAGTVERLRAIPEYVERFERAFGGPDPVSELNLGRAHAADERTLVAADSPFDRYMRGDTTALDAVQLRGMEQFQTAGCHQCHRGPMFSDYKVHTLAIVDNPKLAEPDAGAGAYGFRTPTLRNLAFTAPYMHNGMLATIDDVMTFYQQIQSLADERVQHPDVADGELAPLLFEGDPSADWSAIPAFLDALNDPDFDRTRPERVPSGLPVGGAIGPIATARATPATLP